MKPFEYQITSDNFTEERIPQWSIMVCVEKKLFEWGELVSIYNKERAIQKELQNKYDKTINLYLKEQ